ncbi:MAG: hypothetical protein QOD71_2351 [Thermoleophilaceae bacterium]|nr:hypothetical protein [Thermoleophilaceae bacterium]
MAHANAVPVSGSKLDNRRILAALIDLVVVGAGWAVILAAAGVLGQSASEVGLPLGAVTVGWALYYYFACESGSGQTLGKRVMKIRVVGADGAPAGMREIGLRTVLRVIDGMFFYLVGLIVMLATRERRGRLGDLVGDTMIVDADQTAPAVAPALEPAEAPAPAPARAVSRVPIGESGPAFEPTVEAEPAVEEAEPAFEPTVEAEPAVEAAVEAEPAVEEAEPAEAAEPDFASPSLMELASDVTAVTEAEDRELEEEPVAEVEVEEPAVEVEDEEPVVEVDDEEPAVEIDDDEPAVEVEDEADDEVTVKSVETVSAMDVVMGGGDQEAVDEQHAKAPQS